jgi:hypothetical protein
VETILWRRLDAPGHDACGLFKTGDGWRVEGAAVFLEREVPVRLVYQVNCDSTWRTTDGRVAGHLGSQAVEFQVRRRVEGVWSSNGRPVPGLDGCVDLDLGFTPATNLLQIRRVNLRVGDAADVPVAWLDVWAGTLDRLEQRYARRSDTAFWYEAPRFGYAELLEVGAPGFVLRYPGLWEAVPQSR